MLRYLMRTKAVRISLFLLFLFLAAAMGKSPIGYLGRVRADEEPLNCTGVDLVILVDQSGSMGGSEKHPDPNDPLGLRFKGMLPVIQYLACHYKACRGAGIYHRVAVVYFGSWAETILEPTRIDPPSDEEWEKLLSQKISPLLAPEAFPRHLADTHFKEAFNQARMLFNQMPSDGEKRLKVIILLTDGEPYVERKVGDKTEVIPVDEYMPQLVDQIKRQFPPSQYHIFVIGVNDKEEYWSEVRGYWEEIASSVSKVQGARLIASNDIMASYLNDVLVALLGGGEEVTDTVKVKPYLKQLIFYVHKPRPEARVTFKRRDGKPLGIETKVQGEKEPIEVITINFPEPGWIDVVRPKDVTVQARVFKQSIQVESRCEFPDLVPTAIPMGFSCAILGDGGPLPPYDDPKYYLTIEATLNSAESSYRHVLNLQPDGTYAAYLLPPEVGSYAVTLTGRTKDPAGEEFALFTSPPVGTARLKIVSTSPALTVREGAVAFVPFPLAVELRDAAGAPVPVPLAAKPYVKMETVFTGEKQIVVPLTVAAGGQFAGTATFYQPGTYRVRFQGDVEDPATGETSRPFDAELGSLEVAPQKIVWEGFSGSWGQYAKNDIAFALSEKGRLDPAVTFTATARAEAKGKKWDIALTSPEKGLWRGQFSPQEDGDHVLRVSVWADVPGVGRVPVVEDAKVVSFPVKPMTLVRYEVVAPKDKSRYPWRDILWRIHPLTIRLQLEDKDGKPMAVSDAMADPAIAPFIAEIVPPGGQASVSLPMVKGDVASSLVATFDRYGTFHWYQYKDLGVYEVRVKPNPKAALKADHVYELPEGLSFTVMVTRHPLWWVAPLVACLAVASVLALTGYEVYLRLWTAEGTLTLEKEGRILWSCRLNDCGKHTVVFKQRGGLPPQVKKIKVQQAKGQPNLRIQVKLPSAEINREIASGQRVPLGGGLFLVYSRARGGVITEIKEW